MEDFTIGSFLANWAPAFFTTLFIILVYKVTQFFLTKQVKNQEGGSVLRSLILFCIGLIGFIAIVLAIPMDSGTKGQISSLIGIIIAAVLSLSSATFFGNGLAGILLRSINNFKPGDFIKVGDIFGRVSERGLFHTEVQTEDRDLITLPNMHLTQNPVKVIRASGTFISGVCSLGYDVHHTKVKQALKKAAEEAGLEDAFVIVKELGDFSIVYKVFGLLRDAKTIITARSKLNSMMLNELHNAGIEIVSPSFMNQRQVGESVFIPKKSKVKDEDQSSVEEVIFDKADQAETIHKTQETIQGVEAKIKTNQDLLKEASLDEEKQKIQERIDRLNALKERMNSKINEGREELKS